MKIRPVYVQWLYTQKLSLSLSLSFFLPSLTISEGRAEPE